MRDGMANELEGIFSLLARIIRLKHVNNADLNEGASGVSPSHPCRRSTAKRGRGISDGSGNSCGNIRRVLNND